jgi:hypothetical protein
MEFNVENKLHKQFLTYNNRLNDAKHKQINYEKLNLTITKIHM